jgi:hypothetical protein
MTGDFDPSAAPSPNSAVDTVWSRSQPAVDAAYNLLDVIPSSWTGTAEISTNYFPVDATVYVDYADVVSAKAMLKTLRSFMNTIRAYDNVTLDYAKLVWPVTLPTATITVDGNQADWTTVPAQLFGAADDDIQKVKACRSDTNLYMLVEMADFSAPFYYGVEGSVAVKIDGKPAKLDFDYYRNGEYVRSELNLIGEFIGDTSTNMMLSVQTNGNYLEMSFTLPGLTDGGMVDYVWMGWNSGLARHESELGFPANIPANSLLPLAPDVLKSVRNPAALTDAKADLNQALMLAQMAGPLVKNRTDAQMHFIEYDPADEAAYNELTNHIATIKASLSSPQLFVVDGGLNDINIYLGAFYTAPYVTRSMLPAYAAEALFSDPTPGTFPDPTFGGILPDLTQSKITAMLNGYPLNVVAPGGVTASQKESSSGISLSWSPVQGADWYEVWRSSSSDVGSAVKVATVDSGSYTDSNLEPGRTYYYWVRGGNDYQTGAFNVSPIIGITRNLAMPWLNLLLE